MPKYYFDVRDGGSLISDQEGQELDGLDAAELEAACAAAEIGLDRLPKSDTREVTVEVRDGQGPTLVVVTVSMRVQRTDPSQEDLR